MSTTVDAPQQVPAGALHSGDLVMAKRDGKPVAAYIQFLTHGTTRSCPGDDPGRTHNIVGGMAEALVDGKLFAVEWPSEELVTRFEEGGHVDDSPYDLALDASKARQAAGYAA